MALNIPQKLIDYKEGTSVFMLELYNFYLPYGSLYVVACDQSITYNGQEYMAVPIERDKVTANNDLKIDNTKLTISNVDDAFTAALYSGFDFRGRNCEIFQIPYPDGLTDNTLIKYVAWGYLDSPMITKDGTFSVEVCAPVPNLENARTLGLTCDAEFADQDSCMASLDTQTGTVQSGTTTGSIVIQQSRADNYWNNGIITCGYESRQIESSTGNTIKLRYPFTNMPTSYTIHCGCDKTWQSCNAHGQQTKFGGYLGIPYTEVIRSI